MLNCHQVDLAANHHVYVSFQSAKLCPCCWPRFSQKCHRTEMVTFENNDAGAARFTVIGLVCCATTSQQGQQTTGVADLDVDTFGCCTRKLLQEIVPWCPGSTALNSNYVCHVLSAGVGQNLIGSVHPMTSILVPFFQTVSINGFSGGLITWRVKLPYLYPKAMQLSKAI